MEGEQKAKELALYILMAKYLTIMGIDREPVTVSEVTKTLDYFPNDWEILYSVDMKIKYLSQAIKNKQNLNQIVSNII